MAGGDRRREPDPEPRIADGPSRAALAAMPALDGPGVHAGNLVRPLPIAFSRQPLQGGADISQKLATPSCRSSPSKLEIKRSARSTVWRRAGEDGGRTSYRSGGGRRCPGIPHGLRVRWLCAAPSRVLDRGAAQPSRPSLLPQSSVTPPRPPASRPTGSRAGAAGRSFP